MTQGNDEACLKMFDYILNEEYSNLVNHLKNCSSNSIAEDGESLLIYAVMMQKNEAVKILLEHGADVYLTNSLGDNALHLASKKGYFDIVVNICKYQNDLNIKGQDGFTALNYAMFFHKLDIAKFLAKEMKASQDIPDDIFNLSPSQRAFMSGVDL